MVCDINKSNEQEYIRVNFVEYPNGKRDEWLKKSEVDRIAGPFVFTEELIEKDTQVIQK